MPKRCVSYVSSWSCMATVWSCDKREICQGGREKLHRDFACDSGAAGRELTFSLFLAHQWKMEDSLWELVDEKISTSIQTRVKSHKSHNHEISHNYCRVQWLLLTFNVIQCQQWTSTLCVDFPWLICNGQRMAVPSAPVSTLVRRSSTIQRIRWESQDLRDFACAVGCYLEYLDFVDLCWSLLDLKSRWNFWDFEVQPADDPKSGTVCYCWLHQTVQQIPATPATAHSPPEAATHCAGDPEEEKRCFKDRFADLQMRTPQQFAAMKCSTAASLMPSKDVLPEVGRCAIFDQENCGMKCWLQDTGYGLLGSTKFVQVICSTIVKSILVLFIIAPFTTIESCRSCRCWHYLHIELEEKTIR